MQQVQRIMLCLFVLFAALTVFFQFRAGMKSGEAERIDEKETAFAAGQRYSRLASLCAVFSAVFLALCIAVGAINR